MTRKELLELGKKYFDSTGIRPMYDYWNVESGGCTVSDILNEFTLWSKYMTALEEYCGLPKFTFNNRANVDKEEALELGRLYIEKTGKRPLSTTWNVKTAGCSLRNIQNLFVKWSLFIEALEKYCDVPKLDRRTKIRKTREELIQLGVTYIHTTGQYPVSREWAIKTHGCSRDDIYDEFVNWDNFIVELKKHCPVPEPKGPPVYWTEEKVINFIIKSAKNNGNILKKSDFENNKDFPSSETVKRIFISWEKAVIKANEKLKLENQTEIKIKQLNTAQSLGTEYEVLKDLISMYDYTLPKRKTEEDFLQLLLLGQKNSGWSSSTAVNFMKQFDFVKAKGRRYGSRLLKYNALQKCTTCENIFSLEDFYKGQHICKPCSRFINKKPYVARRRARLLQATPSWADLTLIDEIHFKCPKGMETDHIIPLQGKYICGLNVPENLQYLTPKENRSKNNYHISEEYWKDPSTILKDPDTIYL